MTLFCACTIGVDFFIDLIDQISVTSKTRSIRAVQFTSVPTESQI